MQVITSVNNQIIKDTAALQQKKFRTKTGLFLIEGLKGVQEAIKCGLEITDIFINKSKNINLIPEILKEKLHLADDKIMKKISSTDSPCEIIAVAKQVSYPQTDIFKGESPLIVVLENIKDPGNLGTIIRTAKAAGASGIALIGETIDIFNPKVVRSSAANLWKIPLVQINKLDDIKKYFAKYPKLQIVSTHLNSALTKNLYDANFKLPTILMFGSEAEGITPELNQKADFSIRIPMSEEVESLNLSISVGVTLYEALRQRQ